VPLIRQEDVASDCAVSIGLVNKTVQKLGLTSAVEATRRGVRVLSPARLLNLWATERDISKDVWRSFRLDPIPDVQKDLPRDVLVTGSSAWVSISGRRAAEYYRLFFYVTNVESFESWFDFRKNRARKVNPNVFVLCVDDEHLVHTADRGVVCVPQVYVDVYSADGPEASPFLRDIALTYPSLSLW
jgi:hypothetical protein